MLAESLAQALGGALREPAEPLAAWVSREFAVREALVFVGACGIAVRAVAPHLENKSSDPAVVNLDETGHYVIPLLSGHLGGANALARRLAALTGGEAVVTTATDINQIFAVDLWAKRQGLSVRNPEKIKAVSAKLLRGEEAAIDCPYPIRGELPPGLKLSSPGDVLVSVRPTEGDVLQLIPRVLTLGVGCKRGTDIDTLRAAFARFCLERRICPEAVEIAASIDRKQDEAGLLAFCAERAWPLHFYSAQALQSLPGCFTASRFVEDKVGVDNVCERAAALRSGGKLIEKKYALDGVTFALAERYAEYDWSWQDGEAVCDRDRPRR
jgi:cobalt-precorrin 5A hydrolase